MFLALLCEQIRDGEPFPENIHSLYEGYIKIRLQRDRERLARRFGLDDDAVRNVAEIVGFCMVADPNIGLVPTREGIANAIEQQGFDLNGELNIFLDALEFVKIARSETMVEAGKARPFTFAHRRFQEYFATCIVLREPSRVSPAQLLTDARWRETTVALFQTQSMETMVPIIGEVRLFLQQSNKVVPDLITDPIAHVNVFEERPDSTPRKPLPDVFCWPTHSLHVLGLLQDGFGISPENLPDDIRLEASKLILTASYTGTIGDRRAGLNVSGILFSSVALWLLRDAFDSSSDYLRDTAYLQADYYAASCCLIYPICRYMQHDAGAHRC